MKRKLLICVVLTGILFSACGPSQSRISAEETQMANIKAEETQLAEILQATLTADALALTPTETLAPTETPVPDGMFQNPSSMLETFYPVSEGWDWEDETSGFYEGFRRGSLYLNPDTEEWLNTYVYINIFYTENTIRFDLTTGVDYSNNESEYILTTFSNMLSDFVPEKTRTKIMEGIQSIDDKETVRETIDGFRVSYSSRKTDKSASLSFSMKQLKAGFLLRPEMLENLYPEDQGWLWETTKLNNRQGKYQDKGDTIFVNHNEDQISVSIHVSSEDFDFDETIRWFPQVLQDFLSPDILEKVMLFVNDDKIMGERYSTDIDDFGVSFNFSEYKSSGGFNISVNLYIDDKKVY